MYEINHWIRLLCFFALCLQSTFAASQSITSGGYGKLRLNASEFDQQSGIQLRNTQGEGKTIGSVDGGDFVKFSDITLEGQTRFFVRALAARQTTKIEIRLGGVDGDLIGICVVKAALGYPSWKNYSCDIDSVEKTSDVYLVFTGEAGSLADFKWAEFLRQNSPTPIGISHKNSSDFRAKAIQLVSEMTMEEKLSIITMKSAAVGRLNIPKHHWWNEALSGVARAGKATQFPQSIAMSSTWNPQLIEQMADAISTEARAKHHNSYSGYERFNGLTIWSPTINMARDPRWGRTEETYGEDPWLTSQIAAAFIRGIQGDHPKYLKGVATVKHFVANNTEYNRRYISPEIPEQFLRDYYMVPFQYAVEEAGVESIMTAYNGINGVPCTINHWLLSDVLREEWGFKGTVVADAWAPTFLYDQHRYTESHAHSAVGILQAGVDVISDVESFSSLYLVEAIEKGLMTEADMDQALINSLTTRLKLGQIVTDEDNPYKRIPKNVVGSSQHRAIAREIARQGTVLLKNEKQLLPIEKGKYKRIVVSGPNAKVVELGAYSGTPTIQPITPLVGIKALAAQHNIEVVGLSNKFAKIPARNLQAASDFEGQSGLKAEYFEGTDCLGTPRSIRVDTSVNFDWSSVGHAKPEGVQSPFSVRWTGNLTPDIEGKYTFSAVADDGVRVWLDGEKIIDDWSHHAARRTKSKSIILKEGQSYSIRMEYFDAGGEAVAKLLWRVPLEQEEDTHGADNTLGIYVGGFDLDMASESMDMMKLDLPEDQKSELRAMLAEYPNTILILNGGTIVTGDWIYDEVPAVMHAWYGGQEGGYALAELLFGKVSPSGKLPLTFYTTVDVLPDFDDYDLSKGRTYMYYKKSVNFPFGHGLSYTSFSYDSLSIDKSVIERGAVNLNFSIEVTNVGEVAGDEVVQVYLKDMERNSKAHNPIKRLVGFHRISLKSGETKVMKFTLDDRAFSFWDTQKSGYTIEPGEFELQLGASSQDIRERRIIEVQ